MTIEGIFRIHRDNQTGEVHPHERNPCRYFVRNDVVKKYLLKDLQPIRCRVFGYIVTEILS